MIRVQKTKAIKRLSKNIRSKRGATLVELIATVAILSIVASLSLQAIIVAAEESQRVKIISESQRAISLIEKQINTYARNATRIDMVTYNELFAFVVMLIAVIDLVVKLINKRK